MRRAAKVARRRVLGGEVVLLAQVLRQVEQSRVLALQHELPVAVAHRLPAPEQAPSCVGGIGGIAPKRRGELAQLGLRAMLAGTLAAFMTACVAGILV